MPECTLDDAHIGAVFGHLTPPLIITNFDMKPIPDRRFDWCATWDGYEPGDPIGYGATEQDAVRELAHETAEQRA